MSRLTAAGLLAPPPRGGRIAAAVAAAVRAPRAKQQQHLVPRALQRGLAIDTSKFPEKWAAGAEKELKGKPLDSLLFHTPEGVTIKPVYGAHDLEGQAIDQGTYARN